jgi:hypothetical protein
MRVVICLLACAILFAQVEEVGAVPVKAALFDEHNVVPRAESKATVILFIACDCPIANKLAPEMWRIEHAYSKCGVDFVYAYPCGISQSEELRLPVARHRRDFHLGGDAVIDAGGKIAKVLGAKVTPEAVVLDSKGKVVYRGRINDLVLGHGRFRDKPNTNDLRDALDQFLAGKPIMHPNVPAVGCSIEFP